MRKLRVLDLFSGIGGFSLGLERTGGFETVAFCEIEPFPRRVLAKHWPETYCHNDVRTLTKDALCKGFAESAVLNRLCKEMGGNLQSVRFAIETISANVGKRTQTSTPNGPRSAAKASSITTAASALVAESKNTHFWQLITSIITDQKSAQNTKEPLGKSLSSADCQTIIRFFATIATQQRLTTAPAPISNALVNDDDVRTLTGARLAADGIAVDVITGGFPCQDLSVAGKQRGMGEGTRSGLWSEIDRLVGELRPSFVILENVANLLSGPSERRGAWFGRILGDLAERGYNAEWENIPAAALGAPHRRERVWIVGYPYQEYGRGIRCGEGLVERHQLVSTERHKEASKPHRSSPHVVYANRDNAQWQQPGISDEEKRQGSFSRPSGQLLAELGRFWASEPDVGRVANGVPQRVDRLAALGNSVVPQIPELIGRAILADMQRNGGLS